MNEKFLKAIESLYGALSYVSIITDGSGQIFNVEGGEVFAFFSLDELEAHLTEHALDGGNTHAKSEASQPDQSPVKKAERKSTRRK